MKLKKAFISVTAILVLLLAGILSGCVPPVPEVIDVTGIDITEEDQSIKVEETLQLTAVVEPEDATNKAITWESDNPDVASVDEDGLVTALSTGVANITVTTDDGAFSDTIKITVTSQPSGGGSTPAPKKYEVTFGAVELEESNETPAGLNARLIRTDDNGSGSEPNLAGVEIEIFSDMENTNSVAVITTDDEGMATINLPAGTYYYNASMNGYADFPGVPDDTTNIWQYFLREEILIVPETGISFKVPLEDSSEVMPCIMLKVWPVNFTAADGNYFGFTGINRDINPKSQVPTLEEVSIEIYPEYIAALEFIFGSKEKKEIAEKGELEPMNPIMTTLTTDNSGIAQINLPSGDYIYTASKDGYEFIPDGLWKVTRLESSKVPLSIYDLFFVTGESTNVLFGMEKLWTVTFMDGETEYASQRVINGMFVIPPSPIPTKDGYEFAGWYADEDLTTEFDFSTPITEDITLYAKWTESSS